MNLAFLARRYGRIGGTERDLYELTLRLAARGHSVHVYCTDVREDPAAGVRVQVVPTSGFGRVGRFRSFAKRGPEVARAGGHDLVIAYERVLEQDVARCGGGTHKHYLERMRGSTSAFRRVSRQIDPYHRAILKVEQSQFTKGHFRRVHAVSERVKRELIQDYGVPEQDIDVVYGGVDTELFHPGLRETTGREVRAAMGLPTDAPVVLFLGNGFRRKGLDAMLEAMPHLDPSFCGLVVGKDGNMSGYRAKAQRLGIADRVPFAGQQSNTMDYYAAGDIFVLPSVQEAFGNVVLEAMAVGLPVIASAAAGAAEVLPESMRPLLLQNPLDGEELARNIVAAMGRREALAADAREAAMGFSLEAHTDVSEGLYEALMSTNSSAR